MNPGSSEVIALLRQFFGDKQWRKPLHLIQGAVLIVGGMDAAKAAATVRTTARRLTEVAANHDPVEAVLGKRDADLTSKTLEAVKRKIGELVLGQAAEIAFQDICRGNIDTREYTLTDVREGRSNTDFRLLNGGDRPLYRFNVKFFGSPFRRSSELVGLDPVDCFPLATYKLLTALQKQEEEHLPYIFAMVAVPDLTARTLAEIIPEGEIRPLALLREAGKVPGYRDFEDWLVSRIVADRAPVFVTAYERIRNAAWYALSARRADKVMHDLLFRRVYALTVPGFTRNFPGAEVDMHFSLSQDMIPLQRFLEELQREGQGKVTAMLERGTY